MLTTEELASNLHLRSVS